MPNRETLLTEEECRRDRSYCHICAEDVTRPRRVKPPARAPEANRPAQISHPVVECDSCLAYRSLPKGHGFTLKYPAVVAFHSVKDTTSGVSRCVISNLCSDHVDSTGLGYVTALGTRCNLGEQCTSQTAQTYP